MKTSYILAASFGLASAASIIKRQEQTAAPTGGLTDVDILNFALTLEHLENTFYDQGLKNYSASDLASASQLGSSLQPNIAKIAADEASHVALLTGALSGVGAQPVQACTYAFPSTDAKSFLGVSQILEGVGVSAYLGAAGFIQNADYLTVAASILTVEARHNAYIRLANGLSSFPSAYDAPLSPKSVVSLAGSFFVSCPDGSAPAIQPFPAAVVNASDITLGSTIQVAVNSSLISGNDTYYCGFVSGVQAAFSDYKDGSCQIPTANITGGQVYGLVLNAQNISDASTVAGPFILDIDTANNTISGGSSGSSKDQAVRVSGAGKAIISLSAVAAAFSTAALLL